MSRTWLPKLWKQIIGRTTRAQSGCRKSCLTRLGVENLEDRTVPSLVHRPVPLPPVPVGPALPPAGRFISAPFLEYNYPTNTATWWLQNTSKSTISVEYEVINYRNGVEYGPVDTLWMTLGPGSSHPTNGGEWFPFGSTVSYTSQVIVLSAAYV
jgi:hypothetical protein